jgi:tetratricopeptide (TPR) repeat protein
MSRHSYFLFMLLTIITVRSLTYAQTPEAARNAFREGMKTYEQGDLNSALRLFTRAIELSSHPNLSKAELRTSWTNSLESGRDTSVITIVDPFVADAYLWRGVIYYRKRELNEASADFNQALRISPRLAPAYLNRGSAKYAFGDVTGALADWDRAIKLDGGLQEAYCNRGGARVEIEDLEGGVADLNKALELNPQDATAYCHRGYAWLKKKALSRAYTDFNRALELNPEMAQAYQGRGAVRLGRGEAETGGARSQSRIRTQRRADACLHESRTRIPTIT